MSSTLGHLRVTPGVMAAQPCGGRELPEEAAGETAACTHDCFQLGMA